MITSSPSSSAHSPSPDYRPRPHRSPRALQSRQQPVAPPSDPSRLAPLLSGSVGSKTSGEHHTQHNSYSDAGTQYSPPDWPPTSSRSSVRQTITSSTHTSAEQAKKEDPSPQALAETEPAEPPEPRLRVTPQSSLQAPVTSARRNRSEDNASADESTQLSHASSKRARPPSAHAKALPANYADCEPKDIANMIADMLMELIRFNDEIPLRDGQLTRFHSRTPPGISVRDYLERLTFHATLSPPILLSMVYYIDRLCSLYTPFTVNSLTVHRFLITAATVAAKGLSDSFWTNTLYARVGGVSLKELALLELELLSRVDWRIVPKPETLVEYYESLAGRHPDYVIDSADQSSGSDDTDRMDTAAPA